MNQTCQVTNYKAKWEVTDSEGNKIYFNSPKTLINYYNLEINSNIIYDFIRHAEKSIAPISEKRLSRFKEAGIEHLFSIKNNIKIW